MTAIFAKVKMDDMYIGKICGDLRVWNDRIGASREESGAIKLSTAIGGIVKAPSLCLSSGAVEDAVASTFADPIRAGQARN